MYKNVNGIRILMTEKEQKELLKSREKPIEKIKQQLLVDLEESTQKFIYAKYPIHKQLNIINPLNDYSKEDRNIMNEFINGVRNKNHKFVEQINNCTTKEELDLININFE